MNNDAVRALLFYSIAALVLGGAAVVAFARNIVRSAFALLACFAGMAALYAFLSADLVAVIQLLVYVGGILILILFAVMLTARIDQAEVSNPALGRLPGLIAALAAGALMAYAGVAVFAPRVQERPPAPTVPAIGEALLGDFVLPFEVISLVLLAALLGAVTVAGGRLRKQGGGRRGQEER